MDKTEKRLSIRIDEDTKNKLEELAQSENRTVSNYIKTFIINEYRFHGGMITHAKPKKEG